MPKHYNSPLKPSVAPILSHKRGGRIGIIYVMMDNIELQRDIIRKIWGLKLLQRKPTNG